MVDTASAQSTSTPKADATGDPAAGTPVGSTAADVRIDVDLVAELLLGRWAEDRRISRRLALDPAMHKIEGMPYADARSRTLDQLRILVEAGAIQRPCPAEFGGQDNHGGNLAAFEELTTADPSMQIKAGVQWGLFGSAVHHLGTERNHREFLPGIVSFEVPGCFAMTETGHGSDVQSIATSATYDPETREFVIHTPFRGAWKDYIGNAALHGKAAVVFAKLVTQGVDHGVHAFYVPIRDADGTFLPGVGGEDDGYKGGLNGIDNGRLHFDHVRVPRTNLLNRYGDVAEDGTYSSPIASPGRRFFTMLGTLVQGRVSLDGAAVVAQKIGLEIALTYAMQRRQFPTGDGTEGVLLDYGRHQRRLIPRLATVFAQSFAHEKLLRTFDDVFSGREDTPQRREDLETQAAAFKAMSTWSALDTLQECREACGGAGFLAENRLTGLRADLDVYVTFEGDNTVLLQLVGKRLLTDFRARAPKDAAATARFVAATAAAKLADASGIRRLEQTLADRGSLAASVTDLQDPKTQRELLAGRVDTMVTEIGMRLAAAGKDRARAARLLNRSQHDLIEAAKAHAQLMQWDAFTEALEEVPEGDSRRVLVWLRDMFALGLLEQHLDWYLVHGRLTAQRARAVSAYTDRLVARVRPVVPQLLETFGYEPGHVRAPIALGAEQERQEEARAWFAAEAAAGRLPEQEKKPRA
ncbi:acyl-CoA oxidase [Curtobacterium luteum]|uniref:acyl-CoA oxidase n=1 Tax=Curtobacterium luteum TaxID=33881 RepID=A0A8H9G9E4_9MICO|nr:acyl-CoA dehydrogenase [Curtobacterium luteum]MBM7801502.1 acyl-CoA oxidase [Curtobacterium luteum]NUU52169.1 acyl-CoA dehydrogenase [Curtobacterium luteum]GGK89974.1 acyl-CoA dehydrogenase [Curtobacterium luteum]